jgi:hypothetical protein
MRILILLSLFVLSGCASYNTPTVRTEDLKINNSHLTLTQGRSLSTQLSMGQSQDKVRQLLGPPDETSSQTMGQNIGKPWQGLVWSYRWGGSLNPTRLSITFADFQGQWLVNNWDWYNF